MFEIGQISALFSVNSEEMIAKVGQSQVRDYQTAFFTGRLKPNFREITEPAIYKTSGYFQYGGQHGEKLVCSAIFKKYDFLACCEAITSFKDT